MKIVRFNEDNFSDEYVRAECRDLFKKLWSDKLELGVISITGNNNDYDLRVSIYKEINSTTYKIFTELFEFLDSLNIKFSFNNENSKITIDINNNMDKFISEMEIIANVNKYNI